ncbi:hypothetical protein [Klebsiella aerogenes]|uniref:hypothetical protein n=1 Tax=Klebsiella aerogenes TaxID=548 RepID=UPI0021B1AC09|nr:hypothetical protein [Klebsiella aerogenes]
MNNEIQQIAQQNDMNIEFVHWFFNEKKAACGEQWFLALGAMWEGWKAREGEATALALTLEKSREASGCPAGVNLQDWVKQLTAENVALKEALWWLYEVVSSDCVFIPDEKYSSVTNAAHVLLETPATDRIVAGIKADAANQMCVAFVQHKELAGLSDDDVVTVREATDAVLHCAEVISEGADK